jgi:tetratricopeptide (TPR) repeat protein
LPWTVLGETVPIRAALVPRERELLEELRKGPTPDVDRELGIVYTRGGESRRGLAHLSRCLAADPSDAAAWAWIGVNRLSTGNHEEARVLLMKSFELAPDSALVQRNLGILAWNQGDAESARQAYERAIELDAEDIDARIALATILEDVGEHEAAREQLRAVLENDPESPQAWFLLQRVAEAQGLHEEALENARQHRRFSDQQDFGIISSLGAPAARRSMLGVRYLRMGRAEEALSEFDELLALDTSEEERADGWLGRALALLDLGRTEEAALAIEELRRVAPDHPDFEELERLLAQAGEE